MSFTSNFTYTLKPASETSGWTCILQGEKTVGHTGHGGQVAVGDIHNGLGIAYITNHLTIHGIGDDPRYMDLEKALYNALDKLKP